MRGAWLLAAGLWCATSHAEPDTSPYEFHGYIDVRAVAVDSQLRSFMHDGLGLLRFDEDHEGLELGRAAVDFSGPITESLRAQATVVAADNGYDNALDLTEAFIEWRPYPQSAWSWRSKLGAFYAPISLENRGVAWQSIYSLSPSAINTWIGEEIRTVGLEVRTTNRGAPAQRAFDVSFIAGVYGWGDPMGILLFQRGWALHDHETPIFGRLPRAFEREGDSPWIEFTQEIDHRAGYYAGVETQWYGRHVVRLLHYDNRGDPSQSNTTDTTWLSRFDAAGVRFELPREVTLIAQWMGGDTGVGPSTDGRGMFIADYWSYFALISHARNRHRFTLRYDRMYVESVRGTEMFNSEQNAHAWTAAYLYQHDDHWMLGVEGLRIDGSLHQRTEVGLPASAIEQQLQLALRYSF